MGYMRSDVDKRLLYILLGVGGVLLLLIIIFQSSLHSINEEKEILESQLENLKSNMSHTIQTLEMWRGKYENLSSEFNETKTFIDEATKEYNVIYEQTEGELEKTEQELVSKEDKITGLQQQVSTQLGELAQQDLQIQNLDGQVDDLKKAKSNLENFKKDADEFIDDFENCRKSNNVVSCYDGLKIPD